MIFQKILRWTLKITDFGLEQSNSSTDGLSNFQTGEELRISKLLWLAPELLRDREAKATQKGDVYSFAIICYEMFRRPEFEDSPFVDVDLTENQILENIRDPRKNDFTTTRPAIENLKNKEFCNRIGVIEPPIYAISKKPYS